MRRETWDAIRSAVVGLVVGTFVTSVASLATADEVPVWQTPTRETARAALRESLGDLPDTERLWDDQAADARTELEIIAQVVQTAVPTLAPLLAVCSSSQPPAELPSTEPLRDPKLPAYVRHNCRLIYGRWLATRNYFDESLEQLESLSPSDVADPAGLLFYRAVAEYRLMKYGDCTKTLSLLLQNESQVPRRYLTTAKMMLADLQTAGQHPLDEVARLMDSVRVRLDLGRAGKRVRKEEDDVIAKLDQQIEKIEQASQAAAAAAAAAGQGPANGRPATPMADSLPIGGSGPGNVQPKHLGEEFDWGNLPPKQREEALQQLSKELPSHYREVVEQYFRKLARDGNR